MKKFIGVFFLRMPYTVSAKARSPGFITVCAGLSL